MLRLLPLALLAALALPSGAEAACGVPAAHAVYETADVQVFPKKHRLIACYRPTGKQRVVGAFANDGMGTDEASFVYGALGGRWLHKQDYATFAESSDYRMDELVDLRSGKVTQALVMSEDEIGRGRRPRGRARQRGPQGCPRALRRRQQAAARHRPRRGARGERRARVLAHRSRTAHGDAHAPGGRAGDGAAARAPDRRLHAAPGRAAGAQRRAGRRHAQGDVTYACRKGRTRSVGAITDARIVWDREVAYTRPGFTGVFNVVSGKRRELDGPGPAARTGGHCSRAATPACARGPTTSRRDGDRRRPGLRRGPQRWVQRRHRVLARRRRRRAQRGGQVSHYGR